MIGKGQTSAGAWSSLGFILALCSVSGVMAAVVAVPIIPELFRVFGTVPDANFWIPALVTIPGLCTALLSPVAGYLADKVGLKWPIVISLIFYAAFGFAPFLTDDFHIILATRFALGIALVGVLVLSIAMIGQQFEGGDRDKWLSLQVVAATSSALVLMPLSGFLADTSLGWQGSFLIFLSALVLAVFMARQPVAVAVIGQNAGGSDAAGLPWGWLSVQCVITLIAGILLFAVQFQLALGIATLGVVDAGTIGMLSALASVGVVIGSISFLKAKQRVGSMLLPLEFLVSGITLLMLSQATSLPVLVGLAFINMIASGMMLPTMVTTVASGLPEAVRGRGLGLWNSALMLGQFSSSALVGLVLAQPSLNIFDAFGILGIVALVVGGTIFLGKIRRVAPH